MGSNSSSASDDELIEGSQNPIWKPKSFDQIFSQQAATTISENTYLPLRQHKAIPLYRDLAPLIQISLLNERLPDFTEIRKNILRPIHISLHDRFIEFDNYKDSIDRIVTSVPINTEHAEKFFYKENEQVLPKKYSLPLNITDESFESAISSNEPELLIQLIVRKEIKSDSIKNKVMEFLESLCIQNIDLTYDLVMLYLQCKNLNGDETVELLASKRRSEDSIFFSKLSWPLKNGGDLIHKVYLILAKLNWGSEKIIISMLTGKIESNIKYTSLQHNANLVLKICIELFNNPKLGILKENVYTVCFKCIALTGVSGPYLSTTDNVSANEIVTFITQNIDSFTFPVQEALSAVLSFPSLTMLKDQRFTSLYHRENLGSHLKGPFRFLMKPEASVSAIEAFDFLNPITDSPLIPLVKEIIEGDDYILMRFIVSLLYVRSSPYVAQFILQSNKLMKFLHNVSIQGSCARPPQKIHSYIKLRAGPSLFSFVLNTRAKKAKIEFTDNYSQNRDAVLITSSNDEMYEVKKSLKVEVENGCRVTIDFQENRNRRVKFNLDHEEERARVPPINEHVLKSSIVAKVIGSLISCCITSIPISVSEAENKIFIQSELTRMYSSLGLRQNSERSIQSRQISRRTASSDMKRSFVNQFITDLSTSVPITKKDNPAEASALNRNMQSMCDFMEKQLKFLGKAPVEYAKIERLILAVLIQRLNEGQSFFSLSMSIAQNRPSNEIVITDSMKMLWKCFQKARNKAMFLKQKCTGFTETYIPEMIRKAKFLLDNHTVSSVSQDSQEDAEKILDFIFSPVKMADVIRIIEMQNERLEIRKTAVKTMMYIIENRDKISDTAMAQVFAELTDTIILCDSRSTQIGTLQTRASFQKQLKAFTDMFCDIIDTPCRATLFLFICAGFPNTQRGLKKCLQYNDPVILDSAYRCLCHQVINQDIDSIQMIMEMVNEYDPLSCLIALVGGLRSARTLDLIKRNETETILLAAYNIITMQKENVTDDLTRNYTITISNFVQSIGSSMYKPGLSSTMAKICFIRAMIAPNSNMKDLTLSLLHQFLLNAEDYMTDTFARGVYAVIGYSLMSVEDTCLLYDIDRDDLVDDDEYQLFNKSKVFPLPVVPPQKTFELSKDEFVKLSTLIKGIDFSKKMLPEESITYSLIFMFLLVILENDVNVKLFQADASLMEKLLAISCTTLTSQYESLYTLTSRMVDCIHRMKDFTPEDIALTEKLSTEGSTNSITPERPVHFVCMRDGFVDDTTNTIVLAPYSTNVYLADSVIGEHSQCYFECSFSQTDGFVYIGYVTAGLKKMEFYGYDTYRKTFITPTWKPRSPITESDPPAIGVFFSANEISFYARNKKIAAIPNLHTLGSVIPCIISNNASGTLTYSFGNDRKFSNTPVVEKHTPMDYTIPASPEVRVLCKQNMQWDDLMFRQIPVQPTIPNTLRGMRVYVPKMHSLGLINGHSDLFNIVELSQPDRPVEILTDDDIEPIDDLIDDYHLRVCANHRLVARTMLQTAMKICTVASRLITLQINSESRFCAEFVTKCFCFMRFKYTRSDFNCIKKKPLVEHPLLISVNRAKRRIVEFLDDRSVCQKLFQYLIDVTKDKKESLLDIYYTLPPHTKINQRGRRYSNVTLTPPPGTSCIIPFSIGSYAKPPVIRISEPIATSMFSREMYMKFGLICIPEHIMDTQIVMQAMNIMQCFFAVNKEKVWFHQSIESLIDLVKNNEIFLFRVFFAYYLWELFPYTSRFVNLFDAYEKKSRVRKPSRMIFNMLISLKLENLVRDRLSNHLYAEAVRLRTEYFKKYPTLESFYRNAMLVYNHWPMPRATLAYSLTEIRPLCPEVQKFIINKERVFNYESDESIIEVTLKITKADTEVSVMDNGRKFVAEVGREYKVDKAFTLSADGEIIVDIVLTRYGERGDPNAFLSSSRIFSEANIKEMCDGFVREVEPNMYFGQFNSAFYNIRNKVSAIRTYIQQTAESTHRIHVHFDRFKAMKFRERRAGGIPLLKQFARSKGHPRHLKRLCFNMWKVKLNGEGAIDAGGPAREVFTEICQEMFDPEMNLFAGTELVVPLPTANPLLMRCCGALFGASISWDQRQHFMFANSFYKALTLKKSSATLDDIKEWDRYINHDLNNTKFMYTSMTGEKKELVSGGFSIPVTEENHEKFVSLLVQVKQKEVERAIAPFIEGYTMVLTNMALEIFQWDELKKLSTFKDFTLKDLKARTDVKGDASVFWEAMEQLTGEELQLFLKFSTGRISLPVSADKVLSVIIEGNPGELPHAKTCSSEVYIPKYNSAKEAVTKIRAAINFFSIINDGDRTIHVDML